MKLIGRLQAFFWGIWIFFLIILPVPVESSAADEYKTTEYYKSNGLDYINAADAYAAGYTGKGITLVLFDEATRTDHQEFWGKNILLKYEANPLPPWSDKYLHGTHVAGIMAANKDNIQMHGVAFDAGIVSLGTILDGEYPYVSRDLEKLYSYTFANDSLKIINNSWGGTFFIEQTPTLQMFLDTVKDADKMALLRKSILEYDKILVFAIGNDGHITPGTESALIYTSDSPAKIMEIPGS